MQNGEDRLVGHFRKDKVQRTAAIKKRVRLRRQKAAGEMWGVDQDPSRKQEMTSAAMQQPCQGEMGSRKEEAERGGGEGEGGGAAP